MPTPINLISNDRWTHAEGSWQIADGKLEQTANNDKSRSFQEIGTGNFVAVFNFRLFRPAAGEPGEAKFIYSDASQNEDYRIDFIFDIGVCRVSVGKWNTGALLELAYERDYCAKVVVKDNYLTVYVDDMVIVRNHNFGKRSDGFVGLGSWKACVQFSHIVVNPFQQTKCFVVMPFDQKRNFLYEYVIRPTLDRHPTLMFDYKRADESMTVGRISEEIAGYINGADLLIADITSSNPNVFYELGFAHAKMRKAVLLIEDVEGDKLNIPFDIQDFRCHAYKFSKEGFQNIAEKITGVLTTIAAIDP